MNFGERLKEERVRLGCSQEAMGAIGGVRKLAQHNYEKGERAPDSTYLAAIAAAGADVLYILTGERTANAAQGLRADEQLLLEVYDALSIDERKSLLAGLLTGARGKRTDGTNVIGIGNRTAGRDYNEGK